MPERLRRRGCPRTRRVQQQIRMHHTERRYRETIEAATKSFRNCPTTETQLAVLVLAPLGQAAPANPLGAERPPPSCEGLEHGVPDCVRGVMDEPSALVRAPSSNHAGPRSPRAVFATLTAKRAAARTSAVVLPRSCLRAAISAAIQRSLSLSDRCGLVARQRRPRTTVYRPSGVWHSTLRSLMMRRCRVTGATLAVPWTPRR